MPTYISLIKYTHQGISAIKEGPGRLGANKDILNRYGSQLKAFYPTMGRYDIVTISEAPDDAATAKVALAAGSAGNVTTVSSAACRCAGGGAAGPAWRRARRGPSSTVAGDACRPRRNWFARSGSWCCRE